MSFRNIRDEGIQKVASAAERLLLLPTDGTIVEQLDNHSLYIYNGNTATWIPVGSGGGGNAFGVIQTDTGTSPTADTLSDSLTLISDDPSNIFFQGNATTDTVTLSSPGLLRTSIFNSYNDVQKEPTGFVDNTSSSISFDNATRTFTISPTGPSYDVYVKGAKFTISSTINLVIPNSTGNHYIYFDGSGTLVSTQVFDPSIITDNAFVSIVYWNSSVSLRTYFANERHGLVMDGATHAYLHTVLGARYLSGGALQNFSVDQSGNIDSDAQFDCDSGSIRDEDLLIQYASSNRIPILYRFGTDWRKKTGDAFPIIYSGTAGYTGASGRLPYNLFSGGAWSLSEVPNNQFVLVHIFATNDVDNPVVGVQGINVYNTITSARIGAVSEILSLSGLPFAEFVALGSVIYETANSYANIPKARVRSTGTGADYVDFRGTQTFTPSANVATSHSLLSNLSNDDHLQYFDQTRGDARYYTQTQVNTALSAKANLSGGNSFTGTQTFGDGVVNRFLGDIVTISAVSFPYALQASDNGKILRFDSPTPAVVNLPNNLSVGFNIAWSQAGSGQITFTPASGATLNNRQSQTKTAGQHAMGSLMVMTNVGGTSAMYNLAGDTGV
jgi:hypothetical protein